MSRYQVFLETSAEALDEGGYLAHVPELIGCVARGKTKEQAIEKIRNAISAYLALLRNRGISVLSATEPIELDVTRDQALTLNPDYQPLSDQELDDLWHLQNASRESLLETLSEMPSARSIGGKTHNRGRCETHWNT
jgi:predicted RNase H-like HicB family nuclease